MWSNSLLVVRSKNCILWSRSDAETIYPFELRKKDFIAQLQKVCMVLALSVPWGNSWSQVTIVEYPYNPDVNGNAFIEVEDVLAILPAYADAFVANPILVDSVNLATVLQNLQLQIESLQAQLNVLESNAFDGSYWSLTDVPFFDYSYQDLTSGVPQVEVVEKAHMLVDADLGGGQLSGTNFSGMNMSGANLASADLTLANLSGANLNSAYLVDADLTGAILTGANFSFAEMSAVPGAGGNWTIFNEANLSDADFSHAECYNCRFMSANLTNANLSYAYLYNTHLEGANFSGANLLNANLGAAWFDENTIWTGAFIQGCTNCPCEDADGDDFCD